MKLDSDSLNNHNQKIDEISSISTIEILLKSNFFDYVENGIIIIDALEENNPVVFINNAFCETSGYKKEEALGKEAGTLLGYGEGAAIQNEFNKVLNRKKSIIIKFESKKEGKPVWSQLQVSPILNEQNIVSHYIGIQSEITEAVEVEKKLTETNTRLAELIQNVVSGILLEDENRNIVLVNKNFCNMFKIPLDPVDLIGTDCSNSAEQVKHLFTDPEQFVSGINNVLHNRVLVKYEEVYLVDGSVYERDYIPIFIDGLYKGHLWNYRDITVKKNNERLIKESEAYARSLVSALPDLLFVLNNKGIFIDYKADEKDLFLKPEFFLNQNYAEVLPSEVAGIIHKALIKLETSGSSEFRYSLPGNEGTRHYSGKAVKLGADKNIFFVRDITAQVKSEVELQSQNNFKSILVKISSQYINIPLSEVTKSINESLQMIGRFVRADRAYIFVYDFDKQVTSNTYEWCEIGVEPQISQLQNIPINFLKEWVETHKSGKPMLVPDVMALSPENQLRQILEPQGIKTLVTLPMTSEGHCIGFIGFDWVKSYHIISDTEITLLAVFAELLVNINNRIEKETQLKIEKQNVESSNNALSHFAYIASHDLREPLRKISAFGSLLKKSLSGKLNEDEEENFNFMIDGAKRMQQMIDDLLYYSRITAEIKEYTAINLDEIVKELVEFDLSESIKESGASVEIMGKLGSLMGEPARIKQLLQNLIGNGIKYRKADVNAVVKLRTERKADRILVYVEDNGIGIDGKYFDQIFEMFKRLHSKDEYEGSGIGLAVCKKIVELHGGEIKINSVPGAGSTFMFSIPCREVI